MMFTPLQPKVAAKPNFFVNNDGNNVFVNNIGNTTIIHLTPAFNAATNAASSQETMLLSSTLLPTQHLQLGVDVRPKTWGGRRLTGMATMSPDAQIYVNKEKLERLQ